MLYIWPFLAFFSAPLFLPIIFELVLSPLRAISTLVAGKFPTSPSTSRRPSGAKPLPLELATLLSTKKVYYPFYLVLTVGVSLAIVKFNTIIHPFTLADNRHYMFYIFRYTIRRGAKIRYLLVGAYTLSRWVIWRRLGGAGAEGRTSPNTKRTEEVDVAAVAPPTSTVLLWVITTSLSLITAPLVEPRYFILPWVFYRLLVPAWGVEIPSSSCFSSSPATTETETKRGKATTEAKGTTKIGKAANATPQPWQNNSNGGSNNNAVAAKIPARAAGNANLSLALETLWFTAINLGTMYMFLYRPFYWKTVAEDGSEVLLDGGRVQRFMW